MGGRRSDQNRGRQKHHSRHAAPLSTPAPRPVKAPPPVYDRPIIILEDAQKNTFEFVAGAWVPYARSIAECRVDGQVTQLAQKVNNMVRYEVRLPIGT